MSTARNPYAPSIRAAWIVGGVCVAWFLIGVVLMRDHFLWFFWAAPLGLIALLTAPLTMWMTRGASSQVEEMEQSPLAKWTYSESERRDFARADYQVQRRKAVITGLQATGGMFLVALFVLWLKGDFHSALVPVFLTAAPIGMGALVLLLKWSIARWTYGVRMNGSGEVVIGYSGVIENGKLTSWGGPWVGLKDVQLEPGTPQVLRFQMTQSRGDDWEIRVLVPAGKDHDAHKIVQTLGKAPEHEHHKKNQKTKK